jgi:hypothetical protein
MSTTVPCLDHYKLYVPKLLAKDGSHLLYEGSLDLASNASQDKYQSQDGAAAANHHAVCMEQGKETFLARIEEKRNPTRLPELSATAGTPLQAHLSQTTAVPEDRLRLKFFSNTCDLKWKQAASRPYRTIEETASRSWT